MNIRPFSDEEKNYVDIMGVSGRYPIEVAVEIANLILKAATSHITPAAPDPPAAVESVGDSEESAGG